jgi:hypothetical protein
VKTCDDFETEEEYEAYVEEQKKLWEAKEPQRKVLQEILTEWAARSEKLEEEYEAKATAYADEHGLCFEMSWRGGNRLYLSPGAIEIGLGEEGYPLGEDEYSRYSEYGDELEKGWNYWEPSRNC